MKTITIAQVEAARKLWRTHAVTVAAPQEDARVAGKRVRDFALNRLSILYRRMVTQRVGALPLVDLSSAEFQALAILCQGEAAAWRAGEVPFAQETGS